LTSKNITKSNLALLKRALPLGGYIDTNMKDTTRAELGKFIVTGP
jgi:hypothetical protein